RVLRCGVRGRAAETGRATRVAVRRLEERIRDVALGHARADLADAGVTARAVLGRGARSIRRRLRLALVHVGRSATATTAARVRAAAAGVRAATAGGLAANAA